MIETKIKVSAKSIARLAYGYELMFSTLCHIAGTSGGSPHWFTHKGQEVTARVDPLWKLNEDSNAHKPGDCLSQHQPFADWAADAEKKADALEHWRQEVGKLQSQIAAAPRRWRVFEAIEHGWWGIEVDDDNDADPILYAQRALGKDKLEGIVSAHNSALKEKSDA